jgi:hypothetical protein
MSKSLFAERFSAYRLRDVRDEEHDGSSYDEDLAITVTLDGTPLVEVAPISSTDTLTKADGEPADTDREWDAQASADTITKVVRDRDHWPNASTDTTTHARTDRDQWSS